MENFAVDDYDDLIWWDGREWVTSAQCPMSTVQLNAFKSFNRSGKTAVLNGLNFAEV